MSRKKYDADLLLSVRRDEKQNDWDMLLREGRDKKRTEKNNADMLLRVR